ncbi:MAG: M16 family metallopeptidase [Solitalea-like symbiont of Acarus siro]
MLDFTKYKLDNGLTVILHKDTHSSIAVVNIMYKVGARNEDPGKTGLAHLLEHLMLSGSKNVASYDKSLEAVGGQNNAFTSNDITNYYIEIPYENIETALWLEADRMRNLNLTQTNLDVQKDVVSEEFKQCYLNQPYGDSWLELSKLAYTTHPYSWTTIGKNLDHIKNFSLKDLQSFYDNYYGPQNAVVVISGNINIDDIRKLVDKYFANVHFKTPQNKALTQEPIQNEARTQSLKRDNIALEALYKGFHIPGRFDKEFYTCNIIAEILSAGESSTLYLELVKKESIFNNIVAYTSGTLDPGLLVIEGKVNKGVDIFEAEAKLNNILYRLQTELLKDEIIEKAKNQIFLESRFEESNLLDRSINIAFYETAGNIDLYNQETNIYNNISAKNIIEKANYIFNGNNVSTIHYQLK